MDSTDTSQNQQHGLRQGAPHHGQTYPGPAQHGPAQHGPAQHQPPHAPRRLAPLRRAEPGRAYLRSNDRMVRATPLTVLTPVPRFWLRVQRGILRLRARFGPDQKLRSMAFIHFAHWVTIDRLPGERRRTRYGYLLFQSNFNGPWSKYIDAFSIVIPQRMALVWATSFGFPGAQPPQPFRRYIAHNDLPADHYYSAYPEAGVTEIAAALRLAGAFTQQVLPVAEADAATFATAWRRFVDTTHRDL